MNRDDLDRVFASNDAIVPSSGFVNAVMTAVLEEAKTPAPIPFPWARVFTGLGVCAATIVGMLLWTLNTPAAPADGPGTDAFSAVAAPLARLASTQEAQLIVGALVLTYLLVVVPWRVLRW